MALIVKDLEFSETLDREALSSLIGGRGGGWSHGSLALAPGRSRLRRQGLGEDDSQYASLQVPNSDAFMLPPIDGSFVTEQLVRMSLLCS
jgi:hypothetical protein